MRMPDNNKPKLSIEKQIQDMKNKNIAFNIISEDEAKKFLSYNNYYFKIKAYLKVLDTYSSGENKGKYYNVDFAYLKELSTLDMHLRKTILNIALDIEHYLKVRLINDISTNYEEDGYNIVKVFLEANPEVKEKLKEKAKNSTCEQLIKKNIENFSAWKIIEVLSFGDFINFYKCYYSTYYYTYKDNYTLVNHLMPVKFLRNAAAHNNCLLNTLKDNSYNGFDINNTVNSFIANYKLVSTKVLYKKMGNRVVHDFVVLLYVYHKLTNCKELKQARSYTLNNLKKLIDERFTKNSSYFKNNSILESNYDFIKKVVDKFVEL